MTGRQKEEANAYYEGKFAAERFLDAKHFGESTNNFTGKSPYKEKELRKPWTEGWRHVMAEERLNADTEWD